MPNISNASGNHWIILVRALRGTRKSKRALSSTTTHGQAASVLVCAELRLLLHGGSASSALVFVGAKTDDDTLRP